jgi:hypothetical protein
VSGIRASFLVHDADLSSLGSSKELAFIKFSVFLLAEAKEKEHVSGG